METAEGTHPEVFLLEGVLVELGDSHVLVLHLPKQLDHHGGQLIQGLWTRTKEIGHLNLTFKTT